MNKKSLFQGDFTVEELSLLLEITKAVNQSRNVSELLSAIRETVSSMIPFHDTGILIVENDGLHHYDLAVNFSGWDDSEGNKRIQEMGLTRLKHPDSYIEFVMQLIEDIQKPIIEDYSLRLQEFDYPFFPVIQELGYQEGLVTNLKTGGKVIGSFWLNSLKKNHFSEKQFQIFDAIAEQVSVAVTNILATKEIIRREKEKTQLLGISGAIAKISKKQELLRTVYENIKAVFPFDSAGLFILDTDKDIMYELLDSEAFPDKLQTELEQTNNLGPWKLSSSNPQSWWMKNNAIIRSMQEESRLSKGTFAEAQFKAGIEYGLKQFIGGPMYANGKKIGAICFNSMNENLYSEADISMFQSLSDQIAIAVANILANEELEHEIKTKSILLEISEDIASISKRKMLFGAIFNRINRLIRVDDTAIVVLSKDGKTWTDWTNVDNYQDAEAAKRLNEAGFTNYLPIDPLIERSLNSTGILPIEAYTEAKHPFAPIMAEAGLKEFMFTPLISHGNTIGSLFFDSKEYGTYSTKNFETFKVMANMVAAAVSNILTNEELTEYTSKIEALNTKLEEQNAYLEEEILDKYNFGEIIGESAALKNIYHNIKLVANTDTTVLITGETGTGKELIARAIHEASGRKNRTLIKLNCAVLPAQLIESELFGHEKGAFTGATERRIGKFELAHESTIFLDEVGELSLDLQAKLLRVLQEKEFERIGGSKVIRTNVRVLSATNRDLTKEIQAGRFRADLFYRLNVFPIHLPPLRERTEDIPPLVHHFLSKNQKRIGKTIKNVSNKVMRQLMNYSWPGNIRELEHVLERSYIMCSESIIKRVYLPISEAQSNTEMQASNDAIKTLAENERTHILRALKFCNGKVSGNGGAAELLDMKPSTLEFRMRKLGIKRELVIKKTAP